MSGLLGVRVLVVENDKMNAMLLELQLEQAGAIVIGTAENLDDALRMARDTCPDVAVLDFRLGDGQTSEPVAELLTQLQIPFVLATGASEQMLPATFRQGRILTKPYLAEELVQALLDSRKNASTND